MDNSLKRQINDQDAVIFLNILMPTYQPKRGVIIRAEIL